MKRLFLLFATVAALAIGSLFLPVQSATALPVADSPSLQVAPSGPSIGQAASSLLGLGAIAAAMAGFLRDGRSNMSPKTSLTFASRTTSGTGTGIDLLGFSEATVVFRFEAWTAGTFTAAIEESDSLSTGYTTVDSADLVGTPPVVDDAAEDVIEYTVGYRGSKRYIRANIVGSGSPLSAMINGAIVVRGRPHQNTSI